MRISDWSSDVCSPISLAGLHDERTGRIVRDFEQRLPPHQANIAPALAVSDLDRAIARHLDGRPVGQSGHTPLGLLRRDHKAARLGIGRMEKRQGAQGRDRSEEHTSELQSLMRISYAVFCLNKKKQDNTLTHTNTRQVK